MHPANPRLRIDRELACDALVLGRTSAGQHQAYGQTILRLLERMTARTPAPGLVGISEDKRQMEQRIHHIARFKSASRWSVLAVLLLLAIAAVGLTDARSPSDAPPSLDIVKSNEQEQTRKRIALEESKKQSDASLKAREDAKRRANAEAVELAAERRAAEACNFSDWTQETTGANVWHYSDGAFVATNRGSIGRDCKLPAMAAIDFDLAWAEGLNFTLALYTDSVRPVNLASKDTELPFDGYYVLSLRGTWANLLSVKQNQPLRSLGNTVVPELAGNPTKHITVRTHKEERSMYLYLNGKLIKHWQDSEKTLGNGTCLRFINQSFNALSFSRFTVTEWDGQRVAPTITSSSLPPLNQLRNATRFPSGKMNPKPEEFNQAWGPEIRNVSIARVGNGVARAVQGQVQLKEARYDWENAKVSQMFTEGASFKTEKDSQVDIQLFMDGPFLRLEADSVLTIEKLAYAFDAKNGTTTPIVILLKLSKGKLSSWAGPLSENSIYEIQTLGATLRAKDASPEQPTTAAGGLSTTNGLILIRSGDRIYEVQIPSPALRVKGSGVEASISADGTLSATSGLVLVKSGDHISIHEAGETKTESNVNTIEPGATLDKNSANKLVSADIQQCLEPVPPALVTNIIGQRVGPGTLDKFELSKVTFEGRRLAEVAQFLFHEARKREKSMLFFPVPSSVPPNFADFPILINSGLTNATVNEVYDAIVKAAQSRSTNSMRAYEVYFSWRHPSPFLTRVFKVDTNAFLLALGKFPPGPLVESRPEHSTTVTGGLRWYSTTSDDLRDAIQNYMKSMKVSIDPPKAFFYNDRNGTLMIRATPDEIKTLETKLPLLKAIPW